MLKYLFQNEASQVVIDPNGDISLEVSHPNGKLNLLVSSHCLILASPVFATMLGSQFKEGVRTRSISGKTPLVLLPEDDAEAFVVLCHVIHHQTDEIPRNLPLACLKNLAIICDKYDCANVLAAWASVWIQTYIKTSGWNDYNSLLFVAYVLDLPDFFASISWEMLKSQAGPFVHFPGLSDHALIRHDLVGK